MPWNPEHYNVKPKEKKKDKLFPFTDHYIPNVTEKPAYSEDWWKRHKSYIEHRDTYPYGKPPEIKDE